MTARLWTDFPYDPSGSVSTIDSIFAARRAFQDRQMAETDPQAIK